MFGIIKNIKGFTLVEYLIAIAILGIGLLALVGLQTTAIRGNFGSKCLTTAVLLAEKRMEEFKNTPFNSLTIGTFSDPNNPLNSSGQTGGIFSRTWAIQNYSGSTYMRQITVTISWMEAGRNRSIFYNTVISR
ncbi:MAG: hypothetical protein A2Y79_06235 [Deltaproteobacteria bacterium RBG_13_43_22]|nr:MAG: hypothetical protein A2Y79_06235 [Deltaproteobacteria bacterium RBG_13_43_22]